MEKNLYIDASHPNETRVVLKSENHIEEYEYENKNTLNLKSNIYLGKVSRVEPSLQAAFVNYGRVRHGFLAFNDIQSDYYQIPHDDKETLKKKEEELRKELKEASKKIEDEPEKLDIENNPNSVGLNLNENNTTEKNQNVSSNNSDELNVLKKRHGIKRYKIQEVIKPGQIILVQILKNERGQKGAALSTFISIAGKYTVLMPNTAKGGGISRKIYNPEERKKIRNILQEIDIPETMGLIVRTAGSNKTRNEINKDLTNTINIWEEIKKRAINSIAPTLIHEEGDIIKRTLRDLFDNNTTNIIIEGNEGYQKAKSFMKLLTPKDSKFIKKYRGNIPLFHSVGIEEKLNKIFEPVVHLPSGGYLVINPTEALISIDINSGKSTKETNIERTALVTNLEAAEEISRQIKIRNLSGLIVIDFIDMFNYHHKRMVERKLKEKMKSDRARIQLSKISNFGLLEMSRQRLGEGSVKWNMTLSLESFSLKIVKILEEQAFLNKVKIINAIVPEKVKLYIEINLEKELLYYKKKYRFEINLISNKELIIPEYTIELLNKKKRLIKKVEYIEKIEKNPFDKRNIKANYNRPRVFPNKTLSNKFKNKKKYGYGKKFSPKKKTKKHLWVNRNAVQ